MPQRLEEPPTLASLRRKAGLTQEKVAERMGVSRGQVQRYEMLFPDIAFTAVQGYMDALGGRVLLRQGRVTVNAAEMVQDPATAARRTAYRSDPGRFAGR